MTMRNEIHVYAKMTPLLFYSMAPLVNPLYLVVLVVCDTHRMKSSNHRSHMLWVEKCGGSKDIHKTQFRSSKM